MSHNDLTPASPNTRPKRANSKPGRVDFNIAEFNNLIEDQGSFVRITPTVLCPNRNGLNSTNHVLDCPLCGGEQIIDLEDQAKETWAIVQGIKLDKKFDVQGIFDMKDAQITVPTDIKLYYWHKVEILDFGSLFNQLIERGTGNTDKLRYVPFNTEEIPFNLIDSDGDTWVKDTDYSISGKTLTWLNVARPAANKLYSISYPINPTFRILEMMHENRYYYESLKRTEKVPIQIPQNAIMRLDYLAKNQGSNEEK